MTTRHNLNTDHWSKMRMNIITSAINAEQRGRVLSWNKHHQTSAQHELKAGIRGTRSLPSNEVGPVHNFHDVLKVELNDHLPGTAYFRRKRQRSLVNIKEHQKQKAQEERPPPTGSTYTLLTLPTDPRSDQTRSRVPVLQCRGKI